ncbi:MAG: hypothetical protein ACI87E_005048 [Mariniblastus sp.]
MGLGIELITAPLNTMVASSRLIDMNQTNTLRTSQFLAAGNVFL